MKTTLIQCTLTILAALWVVQPRPINAAEKSDAVPKARIGTYDSRVVAYAYFWSETGRKRHTGHLEAAKAAKASGDMEAYKKLDAMLKEHQNQVHLEVFSTAPPNEAMEFFKERVAKVKQENQLDQIISRWDEAALKTYSKAEKIDVTDQIIQDVPLDEKQKKVIASMKAQKPLSLEKAKKLLAEGKL